MRARVDRLVGTTMAVYVFERFWPSGLGFKAFAMGGWGAVPGFGSN